MDLNLPININININIDINININIIEYPPIQRRNFSKRLGVDINRNTGCKDKKITAFDWVLRW